jgi:hypothetical protein
VVERVRCALTAVQNEQATSALPVGCLLLLAGEWLGNESARLVTGMSQLTLEFFLWQIGRSELCFVHYDHSSGDFETFCAFESQLACGCIKRAIGERCVHTVLFLS